MDNGSYPTMRHAAVSSASGSYDASTTLRLIGDRFSTRAFHGGNRVHERERRFDEMIEIDDHARETFAFGKSHMESRFLEPGMKPKLFFSAPV
jgi:hypothetical protein